MHITSAARGVLGAYLARKACSNMHGMPIVVEHDVVSIVPMQVLANQRRSRLRRHARGTCVLSASSQHSTTDIQASKVKVPLTAFGQDR